MKTVTVGEHTFDLLSNAATAIVHQRIFDEDIIKMFSDTFDGKGEDEEVKIEGPFLAAIKRLIFTMAMQAENVGKEEKLMTMSMTDFVKWTSKFPPFGLEEIAAAAMNYYTQGDKPTANQKKEPAPQTDQ